jgi:hypothetical protein
MIEDFLRTRTRKIHERDFIYTELQEHFKTHVFCNEHVFLNGAHDTNM